MVVCSLLFGNGKPIGKEGIGFNWFNFISSGYSEVFPRLVGENYPVAVGVIGVVIKLSSVGVICPLFELGMLIGQGLVEVCHVAGLYLFHLEYAYCFFAPRSSQSEAI